MSANTRQHTSAGLLVALTLTISVTLAAVLAFLCRRAHLRRRRSRAVVSQHNSLLLPTRSPATSIGPLLDGDISRASAKRHQEGREGRASEPSTEPGQRPDSACIPSPWQDHIGRASADLRAASSMDTHTRFSSRAATRSTYDGLANAQHPEYPDIGREGGAEERVMVFPWSLGERVLAILGEGQEERPSGPSVVGSEALPPYEERDARV